MTAPRLSIRDSELPTWLSTAGRALEVLVVLVAALLIMGHVLGQPVLLGYVESESMAPTLTAGDGFVAVPATITDPPGPGDIVVYRSEHLNGGGLVTHRVVAVGDEGLLTRGDANIVTDQDAGEPPVRRQQIVAKVLTVGDSVVVVPGLGTAVEAVQGLGLMVVAALTGLLGGGPLAAAGSRLVVLLILVGIAFYGLGNPGAPKRTHRPSLTVANQSRSVGLWLAVTRDRVAMVSPVTVVVLLAGLLVLSTTVSMTVPSGVFIFGFVSAENDSPGPRVIHHGTAEAFDYPVTNGGLLPTLVVLTGDDGVTVNRGAFVLEGRDRAMVRVTLEAPPEIGYYRRAIVEHRYLAVLPVSWLLAMAEIHPWLPVLVIDALVGAGALVGGLAFIGVLPGSLRSGECIRNLRLRLR